MLFVILQVLFWIAVLLILHSHVFFPVILEWLSKGKKQNNFVWLSDSADLPHIDILLAVYNEEKVIEEKIRSVFQTNYPSDKIHFYIGSDASIDRTNEIVQQYQKQYPGIVFKLFSRTGKSEIINALYRESTSPIMVLTDANVFFDRDTLYQLVKHFREETIGLVGGNILNLKHKNTGISFQEKAYLQRENLIKYHEGILWGAMIGAFGGCYAVRRELYKEVPRNFIVDDFYITMQVLRAKFKAINELDAICYEDVSDHISEEFRRKTRISAGNFQNLFVFSDLLSPSYGGVAFSLISHKVLRWYTPFLMIFLLIVNILLLKVHPIYELTLAGQFFLLLIVLLERILKKVGWNIKLFRFITHFYSMNLALLLGFINYFKGIKTSVWKPTERNQ